MKKVWLIVAIVVAVAAAGLIYLQTKDDDSTDNSSEQTSQTNGENQQDELDTAPVQGNLLTLRGDGTARECTMSYQDSNGSGSGTLYSDGNGRGRMQLNLTTERGNTGQSNTLITGEKVYSWTTTDGGSFGFVMDASKAQVNTTGSPSTSSTEAAGKNFDMQCKGWEVDEAVLTVPGDMTFSTLPGM